jgi:excisionase family DNA binding protein
VNQNLSSISIPSQVAPGPITQNPYISDILTPDEVAQWLRVSVKWIYDHTSRSYPKVPHIRLGGHLRFSRIEISRWLNSQVEDRCGQDLEIM